MVPLELFSRTVSRMITPTHLFEIDCLNRISSTFLITPKNIQKFNDTKWVTKHILELGLPSIPDISGKCHVDISLLSHGVDLLNYVNAGYVWNTVKKEIDIKATRNFYLQYTKPHEYHFYNNNFESVIILPQVIARKLYAINENDKRFDDIREMMQMIMLTADKVNDDWILS